MDVIAKSAALTLVGCMALLAGTAHAVSPADKCEAAKNKIAGKYTFCRQKAEAKAIKTGTPADYSKCVLKFSEKWGKAEMGGSCPTTGDQATQQAALTANANRTACQLSGQPRFVDNGDGTITDRQTCLMWEKKYKLDGGLDYANLQDADNYLAWAGYCSVDTSKACQPTPAAAALCAANAEGGTIGCDECSGGDGTCTPNYTSDTAWSWLVALNAANFAAHNDWRLPNREELTSIVDYADATGPLVDVAFYGSMCGGSCTFIDAPSCSCTQSSIYWTNTAQTINPAYAWYVNFSDGSSGFSSGSKVGNGLYFRAVRGGP